MLLVGFCPGLRSCLRHRAAAVGAGGIDVNFPSRGASRISAFGGTSDCRLGYGLRQRGRLFFLRFWVFLGLCGCDIRLRGNFGLGKFGGWRLGSGNYFGLNIDRGGSFRGGHRLLGLRRGGTIGKCLRRGCDIRGTIGWRDRSTDT